MQVIGYSLIRIVKIFFALVHIVGRKCLLRDQCLVELSALPDYGYLSCFGARVYPSVGEYDWVAVAVNTKWEPGQKYVYTLDFSNGAGKVDPEKPMPGPTDPFKPGEDVLGSAIKFTVTVTPWTSASENVPM